MILYFKAREMKTVLLASIRIYQLTLSSLLGRNCRYLPTCSEYAGEAIRRHGAWRGGLLAIARISRCHPWGGDGYDPVPDVYQGPEWRQKHKGP
jgi:putative membrane protein insertion efficiency factor